MAWLIQTSVVYVAVCLYACFHQVTHRHQITPNNNVQIYVNIIQCVAGDREIIQATGA